MVKGVLFQNLVAQCATLPRPVFVPEQLHRRFQFLRRPAHRNPVAKHRAQSFGGIGNDLGSDGRRVEQPV